jgi:hypothetical protein
MQLALCGGENWTNFIAMLKGEVGKMMCGWLLNFAVCDVVLDDRAGFLNTGC